MTRASTSPAQLQEMVPVAAVAREPRSIEAKHGTDLASAQFGDQAIEAGPLGGAARCAAKIVVDDLNVVEPVPACDLLRHVLTELRKATTLADIEALLPWSFRPLATPDLLPVRRNWYEKRYAKELALTIFLAMSATDPIR